MMLHAGGFATSAAIATIAGVPVVPAAGLVAVAVLYVRGLKTTRDISRPFAFVGGWFALAFAIASPLHAAGERLLSMHMVQHVLIMAVAAPLLVYSSPIGALLRGLPAPIRKTAASAMRFVAPARRHLSTVAAAFVIQAVVLWTWHIPTLYQASVRHDPVHALQHSTLLVSALLFWSSIPMHSHRGQARALTAIASLFLTTLHMGVLSALFTFSRLPWYDVYVTAGSAAAVADQQLAGVIMWVPGAVPYVGVALMFVWRVLRRREHHAPLILNHPLPRVMLCMIVAAAAGATTACNRPAYTEGSQIAHGDARRGQRLVKGYGCVACHIVPGVPGGDARVGPPLKGFKQRNYIAGVMPNSPENLQQWIQDPKSVDRLTAMPNVGVTARDARDIASYLYSIR